MIVGKSFIMLSGSFNKLTLALNFISLVFAFYFFVTWELEVDLACFNPLYSEHDLEKETRFKLQGTIREEGESGESFPVFITNIDEESCFLLLENQTSFVLNIKRKYSLESVYEGVRFSHTARLVSSYDRGVGLIFEHFEDRRVSWSELYKVCLERGLVG